MSSNLDRMIAEATMKKHALAKMKEKTKGWAQQKTMMRNQYANAQRIINFEEIWNDGQEIFKLAYRAQRQKALHNKPLPPGVPSIENAIRSMSAMGWFFEGLDHTQADDTEADTVAKEDQPAATV
jgi:hypothetical protein